MDEAGKGNRIEAATVIAALSKEKILDNRSHGVLIFAHKKEQCEELAKRIGKLMRLSSLSDVLDVTALEQLVNVLE